MDDTPDFLADEDVPRARVALLLKHFSRLPDGREPWRIVYPLAEVLLLLTCATIASCDDFDEIVAWGEDHLDFLRRFAPFHHGVPCERWVRTLVNRVDPQTFARCFEDWIRAMWPGRHDLIAIDGKTIDGKTSQGDCVAVVRAPHPRHAQGAQGAAYAQRLRDQRPTHLGATERAREEQRDHGHPGSARSVG